MIFREIPSKFHEFQNENRKNLLHFVQLNQGPLKFANNVERRPRASGKWHRHPRHARRKQGVRRPHFGTAASAPKAPPGPPPTRPAPPSGVVASAVLRGPARQPSRTIVAPGHRTRLSPKPTTRAFGPRSKRLSATHRRTTIPTWGRRNISLFCRLCTEA